MLNGMLWNLTDNSGTSPCRNFKTIRYKWANSSQRPLSSLLEQHGALTGHKFLIWGIYVLHKASTFREIKTVLKLTLSVDIGGAVLFLWLLHEWTGQFVLHPLAIPRRAKDLVQVYSLHRTFVRRQQLVHAELQDLAQLEGKWGRHRSSQAGTLQSARDYWPAALRPKPGPGPAERSVPLRWRCWWGAAWMPLESTWFPQRYLWPEGEPLSQAYKTRTGVKTLPD